MAWCADYTRRLAKRLRDEERLRALAVQELGHRLKNKIVTIQAIIGMRLQASPEIRKEIQGALGALANADDLLMASQTGGADLRAILLAEVKPYTVERTTFAGPEVLLPPQLALIMALLIHELATNAAKYGAFSNPKGRVFVEWSVNDRDLKLLWRESDGPPVTLPTQRGFGTRLFSRALEPLGGTAHAEFAAEGLICRMTIPKSALS
jgi:two-component sensor histidine kinase